jgi:hypothetical protein
MAATAGLSCIQDALGGVGAFAQVSSLRIIGRTKPTATTKPRPVANNREILVAFPDRYKLRNVQADVPPGAAPLTMIVGFRGDVLLSIDPKPPNHLVARVMHLVRLGFVHEMLMRFPRELPDVQLSQRMTNDGGRDRLAIDASGLDGLDATLLADPQTCLPVAAQYISGADTYRIELSGYRPFGGLRVPTVLKIARNGEPREEEYVSDVQVNPSLDDGDFRE